MSISTFSELKTAISTWMQRDDLTSVVADFITLAEVDIMYRLRLVEFETSGTVTMTAGSGTVPTGLLSVRAISMSGEPQLRYLPPSSFADYLDANDSGDGVYYTITGTTIKTAPPTTGDLSITYVSKVTALSDGNPTNTILTNYPTVYLYGSLVQADLYVRKDPSSNMRLYEEAVNRVLEANHFRKYAGDSLTVRCA